MNEFFREVDEEYRRDRVMQIWKRYNGLIIGLAIILLASVAGWRYWQHTERVRSEAAGSRLESALRLAREGKDEEAEKALAALAGEGTGGISTIARFRLAAAIGQRSPEEGAKAFDGLAADAGVSGLMQDLARLRGAMLRLDTTEGATAQAALERLATPTNVWRHTAREMLGLLGLKRGDHDFAGRWFDQMAADRDTPQGLRGRLEIYAALAAGGPVQVTQ